MKTTKSRLLNIVIACLIGVNLAAIVGLGYIAQINSNTERMIASLNAPVVIYAPKALAKPEMTAMVDTAPVK
jgi:hypothetical protein